MFPKLNLMYFLFFSNISKTRLENGPFKNFALLMDNLKKKKTLNELTKAKPDKELEQEKAEQATYENNGLVIDDTNECESCQ